MTPIHNRSRLEHSLGLILARICLTPWLPTRPHHKWGMHRATTKTAKYGIKPSTARHPSHLDHPQTPIHLTSFLDQRNRSWHLLSYFWLKCRFWTWATPKHHAMLITNSPGHHNMYTLQPLTLLLALIRAFLWIKSFAISFSATAAHMSGVVPFWRRGAGSDQSRCICTMLMRYAYAEHPNPQPIVHYPIQTPTCTHPMLWVLNHTETYERY